MLPLPLAGTSPSSEKFPRPAPALLWWRGGLLGKTPLARIGRRLELVGTEDAQFLAWGGDFQNQSNLELRSLEIGDANAVQTAGQFHGAGLLLGWMQTVVVDDHLIVDVELGAVVRQKRERVQARIGDPESTHVVDGEPFVSLGDTGEALHEVLRGQVERRR